MKDENINPFVFDIDSNFTWASVHNYIERSVKQIKADISITCKTIPAVFEYWCKNVMKHSLTDNEHIEVFFKVLTNPRECYKHPKKDGCLIVGENEYKIDKKGFNGFFNRFKETHNPIEIRELTANKDRLIKEISRRRTGAFFTPSDWVGEAHKMLMEHLGENYRDEYIFWDCSCGTANLTRDYSFKELYLSTLEQTDLNIIEEAGYNKDAVKFQFDFLNDDLSKIPEGLRKALESGRKIVWLNNPPYMASGDMTNTIGDEKRNTGVASTMVKSLMDENDIGGSSKNLYAQFMYRIMKIIEKYNLKDCYMATFSKSKFMTSKQFDGFREELKKLQFIDGMVFQASHFSDVADSWGIAFHIFKNNVV
jgi:hypothetical protein